VEVVETPPPIEVPGVVPGVTVAVVDGVTTVAVPEDEVVVVPGDEGVVVVPGTTVALPDEVAGAPPEALEVALRQSVVPPWRTGKMPDLALEPCESRSWKTNLVPGLEEGFHVNWVTSTLVSRAVMGGAPRLSPSMRSR
jgi:hypothetical protein